MKIIIDPGHGGDETGAMALGKIESELNLVYATKIYNFLRKCKNVTVFMTRTENKTFDLDSRSALIKKSNPDLVISCHFNAFDRQSRGTETIHSIFADSELINLAEKIAKNISSTIKVPFRRVFSRKNKTGAYDYYGLMRNGSKNTIIIEPLFLDNKQDVLFLYEKNWADILSKTIADTVIKHYKLEIVGESQDEDYIKACSILKDNKIISTLDYWQSLTNKDLQYIIKSYANHLTK